MVRPLFPCEEYSIHIQMVISLFAHTHSHTPSPLYRVQSAAGGKSMMLVSHWVDAQGFAARDASRDGHCS